MRIVVRVPNWLGDAVMSLGGVRALRELAPSAHLAVLCRPAVADIFREAGIADEVLAVPRRSWRDTLTVARAVRAGRFDVAVLFQNAFEAALVARLAGIRRIVGYPTDGRRLLLTDRVERLPEHDREHQGRYYTRIAAGFERAILGTSSLDPEKVDLTLKPTDATRDRALALLRAAGIPAGAPIGVLNPGATNSRAKQWMPDRFAAVGDTFVARSGGYVVLVGAATDAEASRRVVAGMQRSDRAIVLAGQTSVADLVGILAEAWIVVSNDTGPAHVSAAVGSPTVTIFGPTEEFATHPVGTRTAIVRKPVECSPCMLRDCPIDHRCMTGIAVDEVLAAVTSLVGAFDRVDAKSERRHER